MTDYRTRQNSQHRLLVGVVLAFGLLLLSSASALAAEAPVIGSTVSYGITQNDATLEALIDPGALPEGVYYQFQVVANTSEYLPELVCPEHGVKLSKPDGCGGPDSGPTTPGALPIGYIEKEPESRYVRLHLAAAGMTLKPGTTYHYRVLAAKRVQSEDTLNWEGPPTVGPDQTFTTLTPGTPPAIESESATNITSTDATLEAKIDPEGLETTYEFYLEAPSCSSYGPGGCEASGGIPIAKGSIPAGSGAQTVSVDVAGTGHSLTPDTIEGYRVVASNSAGTTEGPFFNTFTTLPGSPPVIDSESVSHLTPTDATLEAQINPGGLETTYEVWVGTVPCIEFGGPADTCESTAKGEIVGTIPAGTSTQTVSVDVAKAWRKLTPNALYVFSVSAANSAGKTSSDFKVFKTAAGVQPAIVNESVSNITPTDATLEAQINTEGLETSYEFHLATPPCPSGCEHLQYIFPLPSGKLLGSSITQSVSLDLNSAGVTLTPGQRYEYWVTATNAAGTATTLSEEKTFTATGADQTFTAAVPAQGGQPPSDSAPSGSGGSSSTPTVNAPGLQVAKTTALKSLTNARKLAKALKLCTKKPKKQRASCRKQAHKKYSTTALKAKKS
jgi:hypothetical protein